MCVPYFLRPIIDLFYLSLPVAGLVLLAYIVRGRAGGVLLQCSVVLAVLLLLGYFVARPIWLERREQAEFALVMESLQEEDLREYLQHAYPNQEWETTRVEPEYYAVRFTRKPEVVYLFHVSRGKVTEIGPLDE